jgi:hypothetical protein
LLLWYSSTFIFATQSLRWYLSHIFIFHIDHLSTFLFSFYQFFSIF